MINILKMHSKPKDDVSSSSCSTSSSSQTVATVKKYNSDANPTTAPKELMITLINAGIIPSIGLIIMGYATPILRERAPYSASYSFGNFKFFTNNLQYTCFNRDYSDLADADQHCIWGRPEEVQKIVEEVRKKSERDPDPLLRTRLLLTTIIDGEDHRGPEFIPAGTLLERAIYVGDVLNEDEKTGESTAGMLERYVIETCGEEEHKKQIKRAQEILEENYQKKVAIEADDIKALNKMWNILKNADEETLESNEELKTALIEFEKQLRKPGNENIIQEAEKFFNRDYLEFGGLHRCKNKFAKNRIISLAQLRRLSACDLQIYFSGLYCYLKPHDKVIAKRIDVSDLGAIPGANCVYYLGYNCHLNRYGLVNSFDQIGAPSRRFIARPVDNQGAPLENICLAKKFALQKMMQRLDNPSIASPRF